MQVYDEYTAKIARRSAGSPPTSSRRSARRAARNASAIARRRPSSSPRWRDEAPAHDPRIALVALRRGGPHSSGTRAGKPVVKLHPVNPEAAQEFEAAMRAMRLGGPEAHDTARARLKAAVEADPHAVGGAGTTSA